MNISQNPTERNGSPMFQLARFSCRFDNKSIQMSDVISCLLFTIALLTIDPAKHCI